MLAFESDSRALPPRTCAGLDEKFQTAHQLISDDSLLVKELTDFGLPAVVGKLHSDASAAIPLTRKSLVVADGSVSLDFSEVRPTEDPVHEEFLLFVPTPDGLIRIRINSHALQSDIDDFAPATGSTQAPFFSSDVLGGVWIGQGLAWIESNPLFQVDTFQNSDCI